MNQFSNNNSDKHSHTRTQTTEPFIDSQTTHRLMHQERPLLTQKEQRSLTTYNHITYLLYVISYFTAGLLWIVPIMMNYGKRRDAEGTWLATHFDWQIKTFWYSIVFFVIGTIIITFALGGFGVSMLADSGNIAIGSFLLAGFGVLIMLFTFIWHLYRIIRGWIALTDSRPVP
ncbi:hypothetical protein [Psychrobacter sp. Cmf 22.2]|uniref:DUF4870 family protein n=1 Tax=Psychrobacter sp. Cmf 22.2 TaxID=1926478 RepID=UPI000A61F6E2|nr:hypothetical protein [Psychrobacter sp. Cmf 22.2]